MHRRSGWSTTSARPCKKRLHNDWATTERTHTVARFRELAVGKVFRLRPGCRLELLSGIAGFVRPIPSTIRIAAVMHHHFSAFRAKEGTDAKLPTLHHAAFCRTQPSRPRAAFNFASCGRTRARASIRWSYLIPIVGVHILSLLACIPWLFSWTGLVMMLIGVHVFGQGINLGYHRLLTHRSFSTAPWVERMLVFLGLCCMEDTPIKWVSVHRRHHQHSDVPSDPHSPRAGFFWSHVGWLFVHNPDTHGARGLSAVRAGPRARPFLSLDRGWHSMDLDLCGACGGLFCRGRRDWRS